MLFLKHCHDATDCINDGNCYGSISSFFIKNKNPIDFNNQPGISENLFLLLDNKFLPHRAVPFIKQ
jgi:hypothetical protein